MPSNLTVTATYRGRQPPWPALGGPIAVVAQRRSYTLGERDDAEFKIDAADIDPLWIRAGSCWTIESSLYNEIWTGFVEDEDWPLLAGEISVPLVGLIDGLLQVEAGTFQSFTSAGSVLREALGLAQARNSGIAAGLIEDGPLLDSFIGGETVADLIEEVQDLSNLFARERTEVISNGLLLLLDFGVLEAPTRKVLTRNEIVDGLYKRSRVPVSATGFGPAATFDTRSVSSVVLDSSSLSGSGGRGSGFASRRSIRPIPPRIEEVVSSPSKIAPAAGYHFSFVEDRSLDIGGLTQRRFEQAFRGTTELMVTLDMTKGVVQSLRVGDVVDVRVANWAQGFGELVLSRVHVHAIEPHEEDGTMDAVLWPHPHG